MAGKGRLIRFAFVAGPTILEVVRRYGPTLKKLKDDHPETYEAIATRVKAMAGNKLGTTRAAQHGLEQRIAILHEQVAYLYASADSVFEAKRAEKWQGELRSIEAAVPMLQVMTTKKARKERKRLNTMLDEMATIILEAYISERAEDDFVDVEVVDDDDAAGPSNPA